MSKSGKSANRPGYNLWVHKDRATRASSLSSWFWSSMSMSPRGLAALLGGWQATIRRGPHCMRAVKEVICLLCDMKEVFDHKEETRTVPLGSRGEPDMFPCVENTLQRPLATQVHVITLMTFSQYHMPYECRTKDRSGDTFHYPSLFESTAEQCRMPKCYHA